jgi:hypothetical protein
MKIIGHARLNQTKHILLNLVEQNNQVILYFILFSTYHQPYYFLFDLLKITFSLFLISNFFIFKNYLFLFRLSFLSYFYFQVKLLTTSITIASFFSMESFFSIIFQVFKTSSLQKLFLNKNFFRDKSLMNINRIDAFSLLGSYSKHSF